VNRERLVRFAGAPLVLLGAGDRVDCPEGHFFPGGTAGAFDGWLNAAAAVIQEGETAARRDRVALNQAARILFLQRKLAQTLTYLERMCLEDPEDLQMHYTHMLCLRGLGDAAIAARAVGRGQ
jgi:hypothetical protein